MHFFPLCVSVTADEPQVAERMPFHVNKNMSNSKDRVSCDTSQHCYKIRLGKSSSNEQRDEQRQEHDTYSERPIPVLQLFRTLSLKKLSLNSSEQAILFESEACLIFCIAAAHIILVEYTSGFFLIEVVSDKKLCNVLTLRMVNPLFSPWVFRSKF